jgi:hypothetical protein
LGAGGIDVVHAGKAGFRHVLKNAAVIEAKGADSGDCNAGELRQI